MKHTHKQVVRPLSLGAHQKQPCMAHGAGGTPSLELFSWSTTTNVMLNALRFLLGCTLFAALSTGVAALAPVPSPAACAALPPNEAPGKDFTIPAYEPVAGKALTATRMTFRIPCSLTTAGIFVQRL